MGFCGFLFVCFVLLIVNIERERRVCNELTLTHWSLKTPALGWSLYRDPNPVLTGKTASSKPVIMICQHNWN